MCPLSTFTYPRCFETPLHLFTACSWGTLPPTRRLATGLGLPHNPAAKNDAEASLGFSPSFHKHQVYPEAWGQYLLFWPYKTHPGRVFYVAPAEDVRFGDRCPLFNFIIRSQESLLLSPGCFLLGYHQGQTQTLTPQHSKTSQAQLMQQGPELPHLGTL